MHIRELSSIRGIAAIVVLLDHSFNVIEKVSESASLILTIAVSSLNGSAAVQLFFVLSGLVLSLSLEKRRGTAVQWTLAFYTRRAFRIFPALWVSLVVALLFLPIERNACAPVCNTLFGEEFQEHFSFWKIALSFAGLFTHLNSPMWSLRVELLYSLLFPAIFVILRLRQTPIIPVLAFLFVASIPIPYAGYNLSYALAFALGSAIPLFKVGMGNPSAWAVFVVLSVAALLFGSDYLRHFDSGRPQRSVIL
jgi:peptidoglycan/LPS O-acetylase OafA/YrhL